MVPVFMLCFTVLILSSVVIIYQDFNERQVSLWVLLLFGANSMCSVLCFKSLSVLLCNTLGALLYIGFIWIMLKLYLFIKFKNNIKILDTKLGKADILVILFIGVTFNTIGMILFFCFGFIFSLSGFLILSLLKKNTGTQSIPLAGFLVFFFLVCIIILNLVSLSFLIECSFVKL